MNIFDTQLIDINGNDTIRLTSISIFEMLKCKPIEERKEWFYKILDYLDRTDSEVLVTTNYAEAFEKFNNTNNKKKRFYIIDKICEDICLTICLSFVEMIIVASVAAIFKHNKIKIKDDLSFSCQNAKEKKVCLLTLAVHKMYERIVANKKKLFRNYYRSGPKEEMDKLGLELLNAIIKEYNKHVADSKEEYLPDIDRINMNEFIKLGINNINEDYVSKVYRLNFSYLSNENDTYYFTIKYIAGLLTANEKFEFNDVADYYIAFAAKNLHCKLITEEKKIKRLFPELVSN